jgi:NMT1/THI5 like protein
MPIRLAENFRAVFYAPFYAAQALGLYAEEGVDVELVNSSVPGDGVSALLNDTIDITWGWSDAGHESPRHAAAFVTRLLLRSRCARPVLSGGQA